LIQGCRGGFKQKERAERRGGETGEIFGPRGVFLVIISYDNQQAGVRGKIRRQ
jgi:hypothetical protein